jgi:hypothetical protein
VAESPAFDHGTSPGTQQEHPFGTKFGVPKLGIPE